MVGCHLTVSLGSLNDDDKKWLGTSVYSCDHEEIHERKYFFWKKNDKFYINHQACINYYHDNRSVLQDNYWARIDGDE